MRSKRIDIIKGIGIILVVLGHTKIQAEGFFSMFHVALFFIAAGFCYSEKSMDSVQALVGYLKKTFTRLYVPYAVFNLVYLLLRNPFNILGIYENTAMRFPAMLVQAGRILLLQGSEFLVGPCWFVRVLILVRILFAGIDFLCKKICAKKIWWFRTGASAAFLLLGAYFNRHNMVMKYDFPTVCSVYILYVTGLLFRTWQNTPKGKSVVQSAKWDVGSLVLGAAVLLSLDRNTVIRYVYNEYPNVLVFLAAALAGWCVCWSAAGILEKIQPLSKVCCYLGTRTMSIMMLHLSGFVLVSMVYIQVQGLSWGVLSADYILTTDWWPVYFASGILLPVLLDEIWDRGEKGMKRVTKKQVLAVLITVLLVGNAWIFGRAFGREEAAKMEYSGDYTDLDFSLVFDYDYYLQRYPDLAEAFAGKTEVEVFSHFQNHGMEEGRQACAGFDPHYYRQSYDDLWAAYGDDMEKYYIHYILWGHRDGRDGNFDVR